MVLTSRNPRLSSTTPYAAAETFPSVKSAGFLGQMSPTGGAQEAWVEVYVVAWASCSKDHTSDPQESGKASLQVQVQMLTVCPTVVQQNVHCSVLPPGQLYITAPPPCSTHIINILYIVCHKYAEHLQRQGASPAQSQLFCMFEYLSFFHSFVSLAAQLPEAVEGLSTCSFL